MAKVSKATKKFQSKHLKHTLDHRRKLKDHSKKIKGRRGNKSEEQKRDEALTKDEQKMAKSAKENVFKDMSVEDFFAGGFEVPKAEKKQKKPKKSEASDSEESSSDEEVGDVENDIKQLEQNDPEFYKYLQNNDKELLDFKASNPLDAMSDDDNEEEGSEDENDDANESKRGPKSTANDEKVEVDLKLVKNWKKELDSKFSIGLVRNIISSFKAAVNVNKEDLVDTYKFAVIDEKAFHELMFLALRSLPEAIQKKYPYKTVKGVRTIPSNSSVNKLSSDMKSHAGSLITLLSDITNTETAALVLHSIDQILPYFLSHRRILKELIKSVTEVWASATVVETQIAAFAFLNNASREFKKSLLDIVLKATYSTFVKNCRKTNIRTMPLLNFQKNSAAELFGIDSTLGYQTGFEYIRQLAIHLRNTISATTKKTAKTDPATAYKIVYNWQFCHSLDFWSRVLSTHCNLADNKAAGSQLKQLIYPLVQVTLGVIRLIPTAQFFPLRFYLIRSLLRLSQNTGVFIPIYPLLAEILTSTALNKNPKKKSTLPAFDFDHNIKCNEGYLSTKVYQDGIGEQFIELLSEFYVLYCKSVSFPELTTPAVISLRRYVKSSKNGKFNKQILDLVAKLNQNSEFVASHRAKVDFGPTNRAEVARFLNDVSWNKTPLGSYVAIQREVKEERARILKESLQEEEAAQSGNKKKTMGCDEVSEHSEADEDIEMSDSADE
ncbi:LAMI_0C10198g1_1 [Lachancea mirantina]|uniref:LAMI_0C10198g1_1 n=1 Tax=Lachancea mirantina TaxID=1230905 RepID=A0A1G4J5P2_9SACH|nr:LAMI_0C10198g1_1 [Lachancea mirantina]